MDVGYDACRFNGDDAVRPHNLAARCDERFPETGDRQRLSVSATDRVALCERPSRAVLEIGSRGYNRAALAEGLGKHRQLNHRLGARMDRLRRAMIARRRSGHPAPGEPIHVALTCFWMQADDLAGAPGT